MKEKELEEMGIIGNDPYLIKNIREVEPFINNERISRTDGERLKDHGIDSLDKLLEECILISNKQSKLPRSIRDLVMRYSIEAYKELKLKAEEIKQESLDNIKQEENDREE